jgi:hypothetical protein
MIVKPSIPVTIALSPLDALLYQGAIALSSEKIKIKNKNNA